jgi:hypothetical protein
MKVGALRSEVLVRVWKGLFMRSLSYPTEEDAADTLFGHDTAPC